MSEIITSKDNEKIKGIARLMSSAAERRAEGLFVVETPKLAIDIASNFPSAVHELYHTEEALQKAPGLSFLGGVHYVISDIVAKKLSGQKSVSGVFLIAKMPPEQNFAPKNGQKYICLEEIQDPANVGAILRTAAAFGFYGAVITQSSADPFSQKALRASMGAALKLQIQITNNLKNDIKILQQADIIVIAATLQDAKSITNCTAQSGVAVCIGNEGSGLSEELTHLADERLFIPMQINTESLNAAAAATVFMWHFRGGEL